MEKKQNKKRRQHQNIFLLWDLWTGHQLQNRMSFTHTICFSKLQKLSKKDASINIRTLCCVSVEGLLYIYKSVLWQINPFVAGCFRKVWPPCDKLGTFLLSLMLTKGPVIVITPSVLVSEAKLSWTKLELIHDYNSVQVFKLWETNSTFSFIFQGTWSLMNEKNKHEYLCSCYLWAYTLMQLLDLV